MTEAVANGVVTAEQLPEMGFFEIGYVGVPCAIAGSLYLLTIGRKLLPERKELIEQFGDSRREYLWKWWLTPVVV